MPPVPLQYPPILNCTNCRQPIPWVNVKKDYAGDGRYLIICSQCSMTIKLMDKWEADWNKKVYGIIGCEEEYGTIQPIIPAAPTITGAPVGLMTPPSQFIPDPHQMQGGVVGGVQSPAILTQPIPQPDQTIGEPTGEVVTGSSNPKVKSKAGQMSVNDIADIRRSLADQMKQINKQLDQLQKAEDSLKG